MQCDWLISLASLKIEKKLTDCFLITMDDSLNEIDQSNHSLRVSQNFENRSSVDGSLMRSILDCPVMTMIAEPEPINDNSPSEKSKEKKRRTSRKKSLKDSSRETSSQSSTENTPRQEIGSLKEPIFDNSGVENDVSKNDEVSLIPSSELEITESSSIPIASGGISPKFIDHSQVDFGSTASSQLKIKHASIKTILLNLKNVIIKLSDGQPTPISFKVKNIFISSFSLFLHKLTFLMSGEDWE